MCVLCPRAQQGCCTVDVRISHLLEEVSIILILATTEAWYKQAEGNGCHDVRLTDSADRNAFVMVPVLAGKSSIFPWFSMLWQVLKNRFVFEKSWKFKLKVLESFWKWKSLVVDEFTGVYKPEHFHSTYLLKYNDMLNFKIIGIPYVSWRDLCIGWNLMCTLQVLMGFGKMFWRSSKSPGVFLSVKVWDPWFTSRLYCECVAWKHNSLTLFSSAFLFYFCFFCVAFSLR